MKISLIPVCFIALIGFASCSKEDDSPKEPILELPSTYNFSNVDHSGQDQRLDMLSEIVAYAKTANDGSFVDSTILLNMFTNDSYTWSDQDLNNSTKQIADKLAPSSVSKMSGWINELSQISVNPGNGSNGNAGLVKSASGTKQYIFNDKGLELPQLIEKGAMGALAYYQATSVYTSSAKMDMDNEVIEEGKGTAMQHHWDEAFGYFGVPADFGTEGFTYDNTADYHRFWAKYSNAMNSSLGSNKDMMDSFIKGRAAIDQKQYEKRDEAIVGMRNNWERLSAAMAVHYINGAKSTFADDALRNHQLSETYAFIWSLNFNTDSKMSSTEIDQLLASMDNLYTVSIEDLNNIKDELVNRYNFNDIADQL